MSASWKISAEADVDQRVLAWHVHAENQKYQDHSS